MKISKALLLALAGTAILTSCNKNKKNPTETETVDVDTTTTTTSKEIDSEVAINNFLDKLNEYKYLITGEDFITINVYSSDILSLIKVESFSGKDSNESSKRAITLCPRVHLRIRNYIFLILLFLSLYLR